MSFANTCFMPKFSVKIGKHYHADVPTPSAINHRSECKTAMNALIFQHEWMARAMVTYPQAVTAFKMTIPFRHC